MSTKWLSDLVQDIQIAVRTLRRRPIIAIVPVLSSALGISACSLVVGIANVALFRPLPVENSAALMSIGAQNLKTGEAGSAMSYPDYRDLTKARSLTGVAA
jgi:putative ABC transport system permease protein